MAISRKEARQRFSGLFTPLMTPFKENYDLDLDGLRSNVRFLMRGGFGENGSGVFLVAGAGGEFPVLTMDERKKVAQTVVEENKRKGSTDIWGAAYRHAESNRAVQVCQTSRNRWSTTIYAVLRSWTDRR